ncbi:MAG: hypothetical protein PHS71_09775, partial [Proteiniphilum sp.]|nr:hypothetical protein [Proteiniphilum sp.]
MTAEKIMSVQGKGNVINIDQFLVLRMSWSNSHFLNSSSSLQLKPSLEWTWRQEIKSLYFF